MAKRPARKRDDCDYLLALADKKIEQMRKYYFWVLLVGLIIALLSVALNLGVVEISKVKIGETEIGIKNLLVLKLFMTFAAFGSAVTLFYFRALETRYDRAFDFLAKKKKYDKALTMAAFDAWFERSKQFGVLQRLATTLSVMTIGLLVLLPVGSFIYSWVWN